MRSFLLFIFILFILSTNKVYCQSIDKNDKFILNGEIIGKDTESVILWHNNKSNEEVADTVKLNKGKFHFSGTVNRTCEALLWTDIKNRDFDDPSVIRFLLEPNNMYISYNASDTLEAIIKGSEAQTEKEAWDKQKRILIYSKAQVYKTMDSIVKHSKANGNPINHDQLNPFQRNIDSINQKIRAMDVKYIENYPNSYLSGYLLWQHRRKLSVDSVQRFYNKISYDVRKSSLGYLVLSYVYPLTNDSEFRKQNPLIDLKFGQNLMKLNSVYDLSSIDTLGNMIELSSFKGKYLVIDFWASWCKPCIENIPFLNQLVKHYKSDSIQFVSISLDYNTHAWKQAIIKHHFTGIQLIDSTGFTSLAAIYCKVIYVPTYVIAGQNGRIIEYKAPQASEPELKTLLDGLLKQEY